MAPDAPTPDPSPAEVLADTLGEFAANEDWGYDASPLGDAEALIEALVRQGYEIVRKGDERHIIQFTDDGWTIAHPLSERRDLDSLFDCDLQWDGDDPGVRGRFVLIDNTTLGGEVHHG